eukprot:scaffold20616_cov63-Phaeocystis_antarctica.AAC.7
MPWPGGGHALERAPSPSEMRAPRVGLSSILPAACGPRAENSVRMAQTAATPMKTRVQKLRGWIGRVWGVLCMDVSETGAPQS